jgi:phosphohistidine phosphatase
MKNIILIRHAKSSWKNHLQDDFDRPLNKRGKKNAPFMGEKLKDRQIIPDLIVSSPAKRAVKTATTIARIMGYPQNNIAFDNNMYHLDALYLFAMIQKLDDKYDIVMCIGHNPGFNDFATMLLDKNSVNNIPTMGIYSIRFKVEEWKKIEPAKGESLFFDYPKRYQNESI